MVLCLSAVGFGAKAVQPDPDGELPDLDRRAEKLAIIRPATPKAGAPPPEALNAEARLRARVPDVAIERHDIVGSPKWIMARDAFLTGAGGSGRAMAGVPAKAAAANDRHRVVKAFVDEHSGLFGHDSTAIESSRLRRESTGQHNGLRTVIWQQEHEGVDVFEGVFIANMTRNDELVTISSQFVPNVAQAALNGRAGRAALAKETTPISAKQALILASLSLGEDNSLAQIVEEQDEAVGAERKQRFRSQAVRGEANARLMWLPLDGGVMRLCWQVYLSGRIHPERYRILVDAETGEVLLRHCMTSYISNASYRVYPSDSPTAFTPGYSTPGLSNQPPVVARPLVTLSAINTTASPNGWINDGDNETRGNNVDAHSDTDADDTPDLPRPQGSPNRVFDFPVNLSLSPSTHRNASIVNLFYWANWAHDKLYALGFDEASGNFQNNNFGRGGAGGDAVRAQAQDGEGYNNANFSYTDADGELCYLQMYLWNDPTPDRDGDFDVEIILHEYVHGLSQRLVGGGVGLTTGQAKGMGEGWSDFYALALLSESGDDPNAEYAFGAYVLWDYLYDGGGYPRFHDNYYFGIRRYPYSTDLGKNPLTFKDIFGAKASLHPGVPKSNRRPFSAGEEVHDRGEVWCVALWEARARLIAKFGFATGNQTLLQMVTEGMRLSPPNPTFLQARDAILLADQVNNAGANQNELWAAFARRGMGFHASYQNVVTENFDPLDKLRVIPSTAPTITGPVGGPFLYTNYIYTVSNAGPGSVTWRAFPEAPFEASPITGTLAAGGKTSVILPLNPTAAAYLSAGSHVRSICFSNQSSGVLLCRQIVLNVGQEQSFPPAEQFDASDNSDLDNTMITFTPTGDGDYRICRNTIVSLPTSTAAATTLSLSDDGSEEINFGVGTQFPFYGTTYNSAFVGANGYITFGEGDSSFQPSLATHFELPRISAIFEDLNPVGGRISWQKFTNRIVVSWENVREFSSTLTNTFQVEMFFDGVIRMAWPRFTTPQCIVGLSPGANLPANFEETDLSVANSCNDKSIVLTLPASATEGDGSIPGAKLIVTNVTAIDRTFNLQSSDTTELTVPPTVILPAGSTSLLFSVTVQNDLIRDGSQIAYVTATAAGSGYLDATANILIHDNETAVLAMSLPSSVIEGGDSVNGTVWVSSTVGDTIAIHLSSSDTNEIVPVNPMVFIPQGQTSAVFSVIAVDDTRLDGAKSATIMASVTNWTAGSDTLTARDNESTNLMLTSTFFVSENSGTITNGGSVRLSGSLTTNLLVGVFSDDESEVRTPLFGVLVPAGQTNAPFNLFIQDDAVVDGPIIARLRAVASGFGSATNYVFVGDNDGAPEPFDPFPPDESTGISVDANLSWGRVEGELIVNGNFEAGNLLGWTSDDAGGGGFAVNDGSFDPESNDGPLPPFAGSFSALSQQLGNGTHALYQDVLIPQGAVTATLSWVDRIRNHAPVFAVNQRFRVELRDPNDNTLLVQLFATQPGDPAFRDWTTRTFNLAPFRGQTVRLVFTEEDALGYLNVHLDDISLVAPGATPTTFDIYFSTNATPAAADFLGSTTNTSWALPLLVGGMDYYWQIKSRRGTSTNAGPVWHFTTEGAATENTLIAFGSSWKYRNTGQDLATTWTNLNYNDTIWPSGIGTLGFGGGEDTTIGSQPNGYVTFYFRKKFNLNDTSRVATLTARFRRDDGIIVHINGQRAIVNNMPGRGPYDYDTEAASEISGFGEVIPVTMELDPSLLLEGTNIVAVEVHQYHPVLAFSDDLYFDFELKAAINNGNERPGVTLFNPPDFTQVDAPTNVLFQASISDDFTGLLFGYSVAFFADDVKLGEDTLVPFSFTWTNPPAGAHLLKAVVTDPGGLSATSSPIHLVVVPTNRTVVTLIPAGSSWSYLDTGIFPGTNWMSPNARPRWQSGPAQLGYGDGDEATVLDYGLDPQDKHITTWFRKSFNVPADLTGVTLRALRDDGLRVYLNGTEIFRNNLPGGSINANTLASTVLVGAAESTWIVSNLSAHAVLPLLETSGNVIAAEVHQAAANSPDLSFDLELTGLGNFHPSVNFITPSNGALFVAPPAVMLAAEAMDVYGQVTKLEFFNGSNKLATVTSPPYQFPWTNPPAGFHLLRAVATDNSGVTAQSTINVTVANDVALDIRRAGGLLELTWPAVGNHIVEMTTNLAPPIVWNEVTNGTQFTNGGMRMVIDPVLNEQYFRLRTP